MARTALTATELARTGVYPSGTAGTVDGHKFKNTNNEFIEVVNSNAAARVITIPTPSGHGDLDIEDEAVSIPGTSKKLVGPFFPSYFNQGGADAGFAFLNFPAGNEADLTVRLFSWPQH